MSLRLSLLSSYHPDLLVRDDPREERESVGSCLVSTVSRHVRSTQKEHIDDRNVQHRQSAHLLEWNACNELGGEGWSECWRAGLSCDSHGAEQRNAGARLFLR